MKYDRRSLILDISIGVLLIASILVVYFKVHTFQFITFDDPDYVVNNVQVHQGLSAEGMAWAFRFSQQGDKSYWMPLTWLSHMLDVQLFGLDAGMHHLSNVAYHAINVVLLFIALRLMTGSVWKSAFVAAVFGLHPVNVDSAAWIAERKNLLSTTFWMLTLITYWFYTRKPGVIRYAATMGVFCLGLLAKPMLITLPFALLLLDYWPLGRLQPSGPEKGKVQGVPWYAAAYRLAIEKVPLIILSFVFVYATRLSLGRTSQIVSSLLVPLDLKIRNAVVSYLVYVGKMFWPKDLSVFYPFPGFIPLWQVGASFAVLVAVTALAVFWYRKYPFFIVGWLWFLGTLVPVLGIVQAGLWPAIAERWAYVPYVGLFVVAAWGAPAVLANVNRRSFILGAAAAAALLVLSVRTWYQIDYWKDDFSLFGHAVAVNNDNLAAHHNLGTALAAKGKIEEAVSHFRECIRIQPDEIESHFSLAVNLAKLGRYEETRKEYLKVMKLDPNRSDARINLGVVLLSQGKTDQARAQFEEALRMNPDDPKALNNIGMALESEGSMEEALAQYRKAVRIKPDYANGHFSLGVALMKLRRTDEAAAEFAEVLRIDPSDADAHYNLGTIRASKGRVQEAIREFSTALRLRPHFPEARHGLNMLLFKRDKAIDGQMEKVRQAMEREPGNPRYYSALGDLSLAKGSFGAATEAYRKALELGGDAPLLLQKLARVYSLEGDYEKALESLLKLMAIKPDNPDNFYNVACVYAKQKKIDESVEWLRKASAKGFSNVDLIRSDPDLENIRGTPYYQELIKKGR